MKPSYLLLATLCLTFLFLPFTQAQTTKRITGTMNLQTEINNATAGDVFIVEAGNYGNITISKRISLYGTGYFLGNNTQATALNAKLGRVYFNTGAEGSVLQGFETGSIGVGASSIMIARNYCTTIRLGIDESDNTFNQTANGVIVKQNFVTANRLEIGGNNGASCLNFVVKNNIFFGGFMLAGNVSGELINNTFNSNNIGLDDYYSITNPVGISVCIKQNVLIKNNIITQISNQLPCQINDIAPDIFINNILEKPGLSTFPNNIVLTDLNTLYIGYPNNPNNLNPDARNQLAANSPAKGAGEGGTDAGAFGGDEPYVLNGLPPIPTIYQLTVPSQASQNGTLNVTIKAKTNN